MSITPLPPEIYRRLLIINPPPEKKSVKFSCLNEIRTYRLHEPPRKVSGLHEKDILQEYIAILEARLARLEKEKELRQMLPVSPKSTSQTYSQASVTSPPRVHQVPRDSVRDWTSRDVTLTHPPANVAKALVKPMPQQTRVQPLRPLPPPPPAEPRASRARRFVAGLGAICVALAGPSLITMVALGPVGLAVAAGLGLFGALLIFASSRMR